MKMRPMGWTLWFFAALICELATGGSTVKNCTACRLEPMIATPSQSSLRSELELLQKRDGLSIAMFDYKGVGAVVFSKRSFAFHKLMFDGNSTSGAVSRDGTEIALTQPLSRPSSVVVVHPDGTNPREYAGVLATSQMCWSYDNSKLVLGTPGPKIKLLDLKLKSVQDLTNGELVTSQCWSPDGNRIAYESNDGTIFLYDFEKQLSTKLTNGTEPTWSPDGNWIAYREGDTYYAINPSGSSRKMLFRKKRAVSGLYWSPDSRFVAYVHQGVVGLDTEFYHLMVRRLDDGAEEWVADGEDASAGSNYQWVANPQLLAQVKSDAASK